MTTARTWATRAESTERRVATARTKAAAGGKRNNKEKRKGRAICWLLKKCGMGCGETMARMAGRPLPEEVHPRPTMAKHTSTPKIIGIFDQMMLVRRSVLMLKESPADPKENTNGGSVAERRFA